MKQQDIEICRKCDYFREVNDPKVHDGKHHFGVGVYCACHGKWVPWSKEHGFAPVSEEEFEQTHIHFAPNFGKCPQHPLTEGGAVDTT